MMHYLPLRRVWNDTPFYVPSDRSLDGFDAQADEFPALHFVHRPNEVIEDGRHRSGWPFAMRSIQDLDRGQGTLFDDFLEHKFCYGANPTPYLRPWIGLSHHPPNLPSIANAKEHLSHVFESSAWRLSRPHLVGLLAMSEYAGRYLCAATGAVVACLRHPTEIPNMKWSPDAFRSNRYRWLVQLGWYLRNTRVLEQTPTCSAFKKIRIWPPHNERLRWVAEYDARVEDHWKRVGGRSEYGGVTDYPIASDVQYDRMLSRNVAVTEVFDASANNVIIECAARDTPLIVNRHPAIEEYLGMDYPLFFEHPQQIPSLVADAPVLAAHEHLRALDKSWMQGQYFRSQLQSATALLDRFLTGMGSAR